MKNVVDVIGYQAVWFAAVIGAGRALWWPGVLAAVVFGGWHLAVADVRAREVMLAGAGIACGLMLDGSLARAGWSTYAATWPTPYAAIGAPPWILALWAVFPLTLTRSLALLQRNLPLAFALGAIGGPLAYLGASRGWHAVEIATPAMRTLAALSLGWGLALPLLARIARAPVAPRAVTAGGAA